MPSMSAVGKRRPVSTTTMRSSYSTTVMFLPISPRPPSGRTRSFVTRSLHSCRGGEHPVALQHRAHHRLLVGVELDVGQPRLADGHADHVQRGLVAGGPPAGPHSPLADR